MAGASLIPSGDFRTSYAADTTIFPTRTSRNAAIAGVILLCFAPQIFSAYLLSISIFGYTFRGDRQYFYVVLAYLLISYILVTNLMRTRDGRALVAIRDHYLSAEIMGINLTKYRTLSFGLAAFFAGIAGALYAHYQLVVSQEGFGIERSILFLAMIIIGGTGSIMGTLMGTAFVVLLPEPMEFLSIHLKGGAIDKALSLNNNITFLREIAIGVIIIAFLMFEPDGLAHRWRQIKAYWKLYPFSH